MQRYKAALFDLDGVLVDTEGIYTEFWNKLGAEYGKPATFAFDIKGTTLSNILTTHFPDQNTQQEISRKIEDFEAHMEYRLFPGVERFLASLRERGVKCAIVTSSDDKKMASLALQLPHLATSMDTVVTGSDVTRSKPDPEGYLLAAKRLGIDPAQCVVFEDSLQGLEAGHRSGAKVVGLTTTNTYEKVSAIADETFPSIASVEAAAIGF